ncbi:hypothetical protein TrVE_jg13659 [Triparma verrucosa]|uniref:PWI domain-containing protein n=1 Tax=Triparma verrucosa TaxID=1606542 RepID=A0A9W7EXD8_9STRA|nr:hypothetical protein TrVE_jg13659 [Triparma verrucosa]
MTNPLTSQLNSPSLNTPESTLPIYLTLLSLEDCLKLEWFLSNPLQVCNVLKDVKVKLTVDVASLNESQSQFTKPPTTIFEEVTSTLETYIPPAAPAATKITIQIEQPKELETKNTWDEVENDDTDVLTSPEVLEKVLAYRYKLREVWEDGKRRRKACVNERIGQEMGQYARSLQAISDIESSKKRSRDAEDDDEAPKKPKVSEANRDVGERKVIIDVPAQQSEIKKVNRVPRLRVPSKDELSKMKGTKESLSEIYPETYAVIKKSTALRNHVGGTVENYLGAKEKSVIDMIMTEFTKATMGEVWDGIWEEMEGVLEDDTGKFLEEIWKGVRFFCNGDEGN